MEQELILEEAQLKTCRCGYHKHDDHIIPRCRYDWFAMLRLLMGVTAYPKEVYYQCEKCHEIIERTTDIEVRRLHV
jgi:hypothetical protein